jgi:hypothetical protein
MTSTEVEAINHLGAAIRDASAAIENLTAALAAAGQNALLAMVIIDTIGPARELHDRIAMIADRAKGPRS